MPRPLLPPRASLSGGQAPPAPDAQPAAGAMARWAASAQEQEQAAVRPVMQVLDLLGRRWALRLIWELGFGEAGFMDLQRSCGTSPTVLSKRLNELVAADVLQRHERGYALTARGGELRQVLLELNHWAETWAADRAGDHGPDSPHRARAR